MRQSNKGSNKYDKSDKRGDKKQPAGKNTGKKFEKRSDKPFEKRGEAKKFEKRSDKPFERRGEAKKFEKRSDKPFERRGEDKKFEKRGDKPFEKREDRPFQKRGDKPFEKREDRPFQKRGDKPFERKDEDKKFEKRGDSKSEKTYSGEKRNFSQRKSDERKNDEKRGTNGKTEKKSKNVNGEIRLNKYVANSGVCSRREADEYIKTGLVEVNGEIVTEMGYKVKPGDKVKFANSTVKQERPIYILMNKPKDTLTTVTDDRGRMTVIDILDKGIKERVFPVGRLDRNTTGVLLLTNDGDLAKKLSHPKYNKKKVYHAELDKNLTKEDMYKLTQGVELEDGVMTFDAVNYVNLESKKEIGVEIHSGKNRIVRRMFEALGYKVKKLDRVLFAGLSKKGLNRGRWRILSEKEVNILKTGSHE